MPDYCQNVIVNGFGVEARYSERTVNETIPHLKERIEKMIEKIGGRIVIFLAAPPGTGKSTFATTFMQMFNASSSFTLQFIGLDGFHYRNDYLKNTFVNINGESVSLYSIKGSNNTYDVEKLSNLLQSYLNGESTRWPIYDRNLHEPVEDAVSVECDALLIEGNWLLDTDRAWRDLRQFCTLSLFITPYTDILEKRLIDRKMCGGLSLADAKEFYIRSDSKNVLRAMEHHDDADINIKMGKNEFDLIIGDMDV